VGTHGLVSCFKRYQINECYCEQTASNEILKATHRTLRTKSMEQNPCWEADSCNSWSSMEFNRVLWNPKALLHVHGRMPRVPILGTQIRCAHSNPISVWYILTLFYLHLSSRRSLPFRFPRQNICTFLLHKACQRVNLEIWYSGIFEPCPCSQKRGVSGRSPVGIAGSNMLGAWLYVFCKCAFSSKSLCDGPISRPEEFYRMYAFVCDQMQK